MSDNSTDFIQLGVGESAPPHEEGHDVILRKHPEVAFELVAQPGFNEANVTSKDKTHTHPKLPPPSAAWSNSWSEKEDLVIIYLRGNLIEYKDRTMDWEEISSHLVGRTAQCCETRFNQIINMSSEEYLALPKLTGPTDRLPGTWGQDEDEIIISGGATNMKWDAIAAKLSRRSADEVEARYNVLIAIRFHEPVGERQWDRNRPWTPGENEKLITLRDKGTIWEAIAKEFPGRTVTSCRLHYYQSKPKGAVSSGDPQREMQG